MSTDDPSSPTEPHAPQSRGMRAVLRRFRRGHKSEEGRHAGEGSPPAPGTAVDIVDQAEVFKTLRVSDVMTPRADINALDISTDFAEVVRCFAEHEHSRLPIYRDTLDDPVGVVNVKDVFKLLAGEGVIPQPADPILHRLRREVLYVPASMRAADLLLRMQGSRIHMALVIDEFGGTDGLVTMEDLVEAVVGDIADEYDEAVPAHIVARPAGVFVADARASLEELEAALGEPVVTDEDVEEEIDTVGGLVATLAGRVPQRGEVISHPGGFEFEVTDADPRRIKHVRIRKTERPAMDAASPKPADEV